jgi:ubiquinone biosynthesis protein UbiJ
MFSLIRTPLVLALNHLLATAEWARQRLQAFAGQTLRLEIGPFALGLNVTETGFFALREEADAAAVRVTLPPAAPFLLLQDIDRIMQEASVSGNVEFAETLSFVFRNLEWDAEADLASFTGDILAHRLARAGRALRARLRQAGENLAMNLVEYARDEAEWLTAPAQISDFACAVNALQKDVEKLEARLSRLH